MEWPGRLSPPLPSGEGTKAIPGVSHKERFDWRSWLTVLGLTGLLMVCFAPVALGDTASDLEAQVRDIAALLLSCLPGAVGGDSLGIRPMRCAPWWEQLQQGKTAAEVLDYFVQRYGEWIC